MYQYSDKKETLYNSHVSNQLINQLINNMLKIRDIMVKRL